MLTMDEEYERDEYHDEIISDRRKRQGEGWRNPEEEEDEDNEEE